MMRKTFLKKISHPLSQILECGGEAEHGAGGSVVGGRGGGVGLFLWGSWGEGGGGGSRASLIPDS